VHWDIKNKATMKYKEDLQLSKNILTIPIDQRVNSAGIDKIISTISRFKF
jgi:dTDP-4-amino-4,6-dideoxygalactose transaminase